MLRPGEDALDLARAELAATQLEVETAERELKRARRRLQGARSRVDQLERERSGELPLPLTVHR